MFLSVSRLKQTYSYDLQASFLKTPLGSSALENPSLTEQGAQKFDFLYRLTFFHANNNQLEVEDSFQLVFDWIKSVRKNVNKSKVVTLLSSLL